MFFLGNTDSSHSCSVALCYPYIEEAFLLLVVSCKILCNDFYQYLFLAHLACLSQLTDEVHTSVKISGKSAIFPSSSSHVKGIFFCNTSRTLYLPFHFQQLVVSHPLKA